MFFVVEPLERIQNCIHGDDSLQRKTESTQTVSWARRMLRDPIARILREHSHLTEVQLESLLIDYLMDGFTGQRLDYQTKAGLRQKPGDAMMTRGVSRGAFNRSLAQGRMNLIKSVFTLVLLGYLGFLETPSLRRYQDMAETIRSYADEHDLAAVGTKPSATHVGALRQVQKRILDLIGELARPLAAKPR